MFDKAEIKELLTQAKHQIISLRRRNEILEAKVEVMNLFGTVLHTQPAYVQQGAEVDIVWRIDRLFETLKD